MTQKAGPMRVISVMSSLVMGQRFPTCAEALRACEAVTRDDEFRRRSLALASSRPGDQRRDGDGTSPSRARNKEERHLPTTRKYPSFHRLLALPSARHTLFPSTPTLP